VAVLGIKFTFEFSFILNYQSSYFNPQILLLDSFILFIYLVFSVSLCNCVLIFFRCFVLGGVLYGSVYPSRVVAAEALFHYLK